MHRPHLLKNPWIHSHHFTQPKNPFRVLIYTPEGWKITPEMWCLAHFDVIQPLSSSKPELSSNKYEDLHVRN